MMKTRTEHPKSSDFIGLLRQALPRLSKEYNVQSLGIFGSFVRDEQTQCSDIDVLVEFSESPGLFRFLDLENELTRLMGVHVDLVEKEALKPGIGRRILDEVILL